LKALEQKFQITGIIGTSMGAIIGGLYAIGKTPDEMLKLASAGKTTRLFTPWHLDATLSGIFDGRKILKLFTDWTQNTYIQDTRIPFLAIAYDLNHRNSIVINKGSLAKAMRASSSIPYLFSPFQWGKYNFVDGGVEHPLPMAFASNLPGELTIVVNVLPSGSLEPELIELGENEMPKSRIKLHEVFLRSVMQNQAFMALHSIVDHKPDLVIDAYYPGGKVLAFDKAEEFTRFGLHQAREVLSISHQPHLVERIRRDYRQILKSLSLGLREIRNVAK
jgi:NTE family protein